LSSGNTGVPERTRILYHMGVNLSAVLIRGEDILGDRVNIAAAARRRSRRHRSHWYHADPRLGTRPGEEENAARSAAKNKKRVSALADCAILALRVIGATNEAAYARFFRSSRRLSP
jgi:hypothetical protein